MQYMRLNEVFNDKKNESINFEIKQLYQRYINANSVNGFDINVHNIVNCAVAHSDVPPDLFRIIYQYQALFKKFNNGKASDNQARRYKAYVKFLEADKSCKDWNNHFSHAGNAASDEFLIRLAKRMSRMIGPIPDMDSLDFQFGPGSSSNCKSTNLRMKLSTKPAVSKLSQISMARKYLDSCPLYTYAHKGHIDIYPAKLSFVPKNSDIDRPIIIEPTLNTVVQKSLGSKLRRVLKQHGVDLNNGQARNRALAREGSLTGDLCTIDLSNASDRIPHRLIYEVLPTEWFQLLNCWRSDHVMIPADLHYALDKNRKDYILKLNKFSSMGNGFTFELETLLFYAIALESTVSERRDLVSIYGDDIICHKDDFDAIVGNLQSCNLLINNNKSFRDDHPFRESCGGDFYYGHEVTPFYLKKKWSAIESVKFLNHIRHSAIYEEVFLTLSKYFNFSFDTGPSGYGLGYFVADHIRKESVSSTLSGYYVTTYRFKPNKIPKFDMLGDELFAYYVAMSYTGISASQKADLYSVRGTSNKMYRARVYIL